MSYIKQIPGKYNPQYGSISHYVSDKPTVYKCMCSQCGRITSNDFNLPFFKMLKADRRLKKGKDIVVSTYTCGCVGWS